MMRQVFIQHKINGRYQSAASPLTKVVITRNDDKGQRRYYFTHYERQVKS